MKCKPGDLAIIVNGGDFSKIHIGKIVRCIKIMPSDEGINGWETEPELEVKVGDDIHCILWIDYHLRPIRDSDKEDEMLRIVKITEEV